MNYRAITSVVFVIVSTALCSKPPILLIDPWRNTFVCGVVQTNLAQASTFFERNHPCVLLCWERSVYQDLFKKTPCLHSFIPYRMGKRHWQKMLEAEVRALDQKYGIKIMVTLRYEDVPQLISLGKQLAIKVVLYRVASLEEDALLANISLLQGLDGCIGMPQVIEKLREEAQSRGVSIKHFAVTTPFWDEKKCNIIVHESRHEYLKRALGEAIQDAPIVATIAHFSNPCKNHQLLFRALKIVKTVYGKKFHAICAGSGKLLGAMQQLVKELDIADCVHCVGSIADTATLLFHSSMHVLPSYFENFSLANLEAAYIKKPVIMARGIDASQLVVENETGLLFTNNDVADLAQKIKYMLDNPILGKSMGEHGHCFVMQRYSNEVLYERWQHFLHELLE